MLFTCAACGRPDHLTADCPAPNEREVVGYLCRHADPPQTIRPGYQCAEDEPIHLGDTVTTHVAYLTDGKVQETTVRTLARTTVSIFRGCRAERNGRPACDLPEGHNASFNHHDPVTDTYWRDE